MWASLLFLGWNAGLEPLQRHCNYSFSLSIPLKVLWFTPGKQTTITWEEEVWIRFLALPPWLWFFLLRHYHMPSSSCLSCIELSAMKSSSGDAASAVKKGFCKNMLYPFPTKWATPQKRCCCQPCKSVRRLMLMWSCGKNTLPQWTWPLWRVF